MANRKAVAWVPFVVLILFIVSVAAVVYYRDKGIEKVMSFGAPQREILETYADGEAARQYIARSAKYASSQAVFSLLQNGGYEQVACPPDVYPQCDIFLGTEKVQNFACSEEFPDPKCDGYEVNSLCKVFPCEQSTQAQLVCYQNPDETISCKLIRNLITLEEFGCSSLDVDKCGTYGANLDENGKTLDFRMYCEQITVEKECQTSKCDSIGEYSYWYDGGSCFPSSEEVGGVFNEIFLDNFDRFLYAYSGIPLDGQRYTLYDEVQLNLKIDLNTGVIEGIPSVESSVMDAEDEDGNIVGSETVTQESYLLFAKKITDPKGLQPPVSIEYSVNPYFKYQMSTTPYSLLLKARDKANSALTTISSCSDAIDKCARQAQESLASDTDFTWKITGENKEGANIVKFNAIPKGVQLFGVDPSGEIVSLQSAPAIRFAVKYAGTAPNI